MQQFKITDSGVFSLQDAVLEARCTTVLILRGKLSGAENPIFGAAKKPTHKRA